MSLQPYWEREGVTLYHGDALELLASLPEGSRDMVSTDPPYGHNNADNGDLISRAPARKARPDPRPCLLEV